MNNKRCITCKYYEPFFSSCNIYTQEVYLGEGDFDVQPVSIKEIKENECKYENKFD